MIVFRLLFVISSIVTINENVLCYTCRPIKAAILVEAKTGEVIYSFNENKQTQPASLTKMMTLLLTFKALKNKQISPSTRIKFSQNACKQKPCKLGVKKGCSISVKEAVLALITKSANDVAVALAEHIGKTEGNFVKMMNAEAKRLGMKSTVFFNPSGWKNTKQLTTVKDMAKLSRALIVEYPGYYHLFSTKQFIYGRKKMRNHNMLLGQRCGFLVDGIKTGFVNASGYNLAASATKGKNRLIAIVLGGRSRYERDRQVQALLKRGFSKIISRSILEKINSKQTKKSKMPYLHNRSGIYNKLQLLSKGE